MTSANPQVNHRPQAELCHGNGGCRRRIHHPLISARDNDRLRVLPQESRIEFPVAAGYLLRFVKLSDQILRLRVHRSLNQKHRLFFEIVILHLFLISVFSSSTFSFLLYLLYVVKLPDVKGRIFFLTDTAFCFKVLV